MQTHADLIDELGGGTAVAVALWGDGCDGKRREAVYKWKRNGIPWRWRSTVERLARERGVTLPAGFLLPAGDSTPSPADLTAA